MTIKQTSILLSRIAFFVIYFWFGLLKVIGQSPASEMVEQMFDKTIGHMPFITFGVFIILFGIFEMVIGVLFIIPGKEKWALILFFIHMVSTTLPLIIMPSVWTQMFVPTLEGQYIVKNLALIACALTIWSVTNPFKSYESNESILTT